MDLPSSSTLCLSLNKVSIKNLPLPTLKPNYIRIQTIFSCVSYGTESSSIVNLNTPLLTRALSKPDQLSQVLRTVQDRGIRRTFAVVSEKKASFSPLGYSCVGRIIETFDSSSFKVGDVVACAGVNYATHGTINTVPESLCALVSDSIDLKSASTVALGSIALHSFRRSKSQVGSNILIIGLGPLGILAAEIAFASGCNVVGFDISNERVDFASSILPSSTFFNTLDPVFSTIQEQFLGFFDSTIVAASSSSETLLDEAAKYLAIKGKLVILGDVPIQSDRSSIYKKEIDLLISSSYGPGRYDDSFEELNIKYPLEHVRWTETENFKTYLSLIDRGLINSVKSSCKVISQDQYITSLQCPTDSLFLLINYPASSSSNILDKASASSIPYIYSDCLRSDQVVVDFVGLSGYLKSMIIPFLLPYKSRNKLVFRNCYSSSPSNSSSFASYYDLNSFADDELFFNYSSYDAKKLLVIASAHSDHSKYIVRALNEGYIVYCEKPLCLSYDELNLITDTLRNPSKPGSFILLGYNRRFSPHTLKAKQFCLENSHNRIVNTCITYTINVKSIDNHPWLTLFNQGSRNVGETCHMYDFCNNFFDEVPLSVHAHSISSAKPTDSFVVVLTYPDNNSAIIVYTLTGNINVPKEIIDIKSELANIQIVDYKSTRLSTFSSSSSFTTKRVDKGQQNMWNYYIDSILNSSIPPIPYQQLASASQISLQVDELIS